MRTKLSLTLGPRQPLSRQSAWGCLTTNLAAPGFGSLLAGRVVGYFQILSTTVGFALTSIFGVRTLIWFVSNWTQLKQLQETDLGAFLHEMWLNLRWPFLGMALFFFALVWALATSLGIIAEARAAEKSAAARSVPPRI